MLKILPQTLKIQALAPWVNGPPVGLDGPGRRNPGEGEEGSSRQQGSAPKEQEHHQRSDHQEAERGQFRTGDQRGEPPRFGQKPGRPQQAQPTPNQVDPAQGRKGPSVTGRDCGPDQEEIGNQGALSPGNRKGQKTGSPDRGPEVQLGQGPREVEGSMGQEDQTGGGEQRRQAARLDHGGGGGGGGRRPR